MKYVVLHNHPEGLIMSQQQRDLLLSAGNVIAVTECSLHSMQPEFIKRFTRRPLTVILWGMADRYGIAEKEGVEALEARSWNDTHNYCQNLRPYEKEWVDEEGNKHPWTHWRRMDEPLLVEVQNGLVQLYADI